MAMQDSEIERRAVERVASIFSVPVGKVERNWRFGHELKSSFRSDFRRNELDRINDDIHDVADREVLREYKAGVLTISTVGDYCDLMVRCSKKEERKVLQVLKE
jgi:hypothetical protein